MNSRETKELVELMSQISSAIDRTRFSVDHKMLVLTAALMLQNRRREKLKYNITRIIMGGLVLITAMILMIKYIELWT